MYYFFLQEELIFQYEIPADQFTSRSYFIELVVDILDACDVPPFIYIADARSVLIVLDAAKKKSWRIQDKSMFPVADYSEIQVNGMYCHSSNPTQIVMI